MNIPSILPDGYIPTPEFAASIPWDVEYVRADDYGWCRAEYIGRRDGTIHWVRETHTSGRDIRADWAIRAGRGC